VDIAAWLRGLGLGEYAAAFRANEIDAVVLPRLTAEDLKDLGVTLVPASRMSPRLLLIGCRRGQRAEMISG
jgi:hypothetical protein